MKKAWDILSPLPMGKTIFSKLLGRSAPYTGTIDAKVCELRKGYARVEMRDQKGVRNHLESIHAIALVNLAEVSTGIAVLYSLPDDARGILTGLSIEYLKKARGLLTSECRPEDLPTTNEKAEYEAQAEITDQSGDLVARAKATWLIGPIA